MADLKENKKAMAMLEAIGVNADAISIAVKLNEGDTFKIVSMCKFNELGDLVNLGYTTSIGARIATRNFLDIDLGEDAPKVGNTAGENAVFGAYCAEEGIEFKVNKITVEQREYEGRPYERKTYHLEVVL